MYTTFYNIVATYKHWLHLRIYNNIYTYIYIYIILYIPFPAAFTWSLSLVETACPILNMFQENNNEQARTT